MTDCRVQPDERGFTLIELLVVVAIVAILAAVSVPYYAHYKALAYDAQAQSDLRNGVVAQEAAFVVSEAYVTCTDDGCVCHDTQNPAACVREGQLPGLRISPTVKIEFEAGDDEEGASYFTGQSRSSKGTGTVYSFDSREGRVLTTDEGFNE